MSCHRRLSIIADIVAGTPRERLSLGACEALVTGTRLNAAILSHGILMHNGN